MLANSATGDNMIIGARRVVTFRYSKMLLLKVTTESIDSLITGTTITVAQF